MKSCSFVLALSLWCVNASTVIGVKITMQPGDLFPGEQYRLVFTTSTTRDATSSDIEDYNQFVQSAADAAPIVGDWHLEWRAITSTSTMDARDNTESNPEISLGVPIYRLDGEQVALDYAHLWADNLGLLVRLPITELGTVLTKDPLFDGIPVWTGSTKTGVAFVASGGPLVMGSESVVVGYADHIGNPITGSTVDAPFNLPLYAISDVLTAVDRPTDCNHDGFIDVGDFVCSNEVGMTDELLSELGLLPGDFDGEGGVAFADFLILSSKFDQELGQYAQGDINGDGRVSFPDFLILSENFGKGAIAGTAAVPEPSSLVLLGLALCGFGAFRRRRSV